MQESLKNQISFIIGIPTRTIYTNYQNPLSPYSVFEVEIQETNMVINQRTINVVLQTSSPEKNNHIYKFFGTLENHNRYGPTFKCDTYIRNIPINSIQVVEFLSSGLFHGIKNKRAEQIVDKFGEDCLVKIINSPEILRQIKGIPEKTIETIQEVIIENLGMQNIITKLHEWNISLKLAKKIFRLYGDASVQTIIENPYCLANTVRGVSFNKADEIAEKLEILGSDGRRIKGAIEYALHEIFEEEGSTFRNKGYVMQKAAKILYERDKYHYPSDIINKNLIELIASDIDEIEDFTTVIGQVRQVENRIYLAKYYSYEQQIAEKLSSLNLKHENLLEKEINVLFDKFFSLKEQFPFEFSKEQDMAVIGSILNNVLIITGGPGTGKSTIIDIILRLHYYFYQFDPDSFLKKKVLLAPTGRAAKRMTEITGFSAQTIHQFLLTRESTDKTEENRLFIIDEMSMIDISLMNRLLEQLNPGDKIILVGDKDQLPPIGAGNVFLDILNSDRFFTVELSTVFRQQQDSTINQLAASIRTNEFSADLIENTTNVKWLPATKDDIVKTIQTEIFSAIKQGIPFKDMQIIAPVHKGEQGITFINTSIQSLLIDGEIESKKEFLSTGFSNQKYEFFTGDRVIQLKNNSDKNLMNGDLGIVIGVEPAFEEVQYDEITKKEEILEEPERLNVRFGDTEIYYYREELDQLALAYCFSVHKAQGSEFPYVLLPISSAYIRMMNRNLLYTAITRAKNEIKIIGELDFFLKGIEAEPRQRYTFLQEMLAEKRKSTL